MYKSFRSILLLVLCLFVGCGSHLEYVKESGTYDHVLAKEIPIFVASGMVLPEHWRAEIYDELARFPQAHKLLAAVNVSLSLTHHVHGELQGLWDGDTIFLAVKKMPVLRHVLQHELAHVIYDTTTGDQQEAWRMLYYKRLKENGWDTRPDAAPALLPANFPTIYSMTNSKEFVAEHLEYLLTDTPDALKRFQEEYELLSIQGYLPKDWKY